MLKLLQVMTGNLLKVFYLSTMVNMSKFRTIAIVDMVGWLKRLN